MAKQIIALMLGTMLAGCSWLDRHNEPKPDLVEGGYYRMYELLPEYCDSENICHEIRPEDRELILDSIANAICN